MKQKITRAALCVFVAAALVSLSTYAVLRHAWAAVALLALSGAIFGYVLAVSITRHDR
jgi:membrane associated rhomboid family serine protease